MIKIICVGKIKEKFFKDATDEYLKRLSKYTKVKIIELPDYNYDVSKTLTEEGKNILAKIDNKDFVIIMDINGDGVDSYALAKRINDWQTLNLTFVIGGSYGLSEEVKKRGDYFLSFSLLTFPHQLFRVMLLEQIYRAFKIINNEAYHK